MLPRLITIHQSHQHMAFTDGDSPVYLFEVCKQHCERSVLIIFYSMFIVRKMGFKENHLPIAKCINAKQIYFFSLIKKINTANRNLLTSIKGFQQFNIHEVLIDV